MKKDYSAYFFLLPAIAVIFTFHLFPIFTALFMSFFKWNILSGQMKFVFLDNFKQLLHDREFYKSLYNTFYYVIFTVPVGIFLSLVVAVLLNQKIKLVGWYRLLYFLPVITSMNAVAIVWKWIYHPNYGLLNYILSFFNIGPIDWLNDPRFAMPAIIIMSIWKNLGYNVVIFLAALQNVPKELYEAADIDGASSIKKFFYITIPMISPTIYFVLITSTIASFQVFAQIYIMTPNGGPLRSTTVVVYYLYQLAFEQFKTGYACAMTFVMFLIIGAMTLLQRKLTESKVHYES